MRTSLLFKPILQSTKLSWDQHEWRPTNFANFRVELESLLSEIGETCLFRGQKRVDWLLDSTLARRIKEQKGMKETQLYTIQDLEEVKLQHDLARIWIKKFRSITLSPELKQIADQGLDPYFEFHRHAQQNQDDYLIKDFKPLGTNFIDFTYNWRVGLFFANRGRENDEEGALFIVRQKALGPVLFRSNSAVYDKVCELERWLEENPGKMYGHLPLMIYPERQLKNIYDPKPERQSAVYLVQTDLRCDLEFSWKSLTEINGNQVFAKLILPAGTHNEVENFLMSEDITEEFLFPLTIFDKISSSEEKGKVAR